MVRGKLLVTRKRKWILCIVIVVLFLIVVTILGNWNVKKTANGKADSTTVEVEEAVETAVPKEEWKEEERAIEIRAVQLADSLQEGDQVDVRIRYPDGEEYILLSKRGCYNINKEESRMTMWLCEEELLRLSSSMVDAVYTDSLLYLVRYHKELEQKPSKITYIPRKEVQQLIKNDPNIVGKAESILSNKLREELEERQLRWKESSETTDWVRQQREEEHNNKEEIIYVD